MFFADLCYSGTVMDNDAKPRLSSSELLSIVSGRSSILDPAQVKKQILCTKERFLHGLEYFKVPSPASEAKVKADKNIKRTDFILKLSKLLNLDEVQTHQLFQAYIRTDFRGSSAQLQGLSYFLDLYSQNYCAQGTIEVYHISHQRFWHCVHLFVYQLNPKQSSSSTRKYLNGILRHDFQTEDFILKVTEYYHKERTAVLTCIKHIFGYWQNEECLFREQFAGLVEDLITDGFIEKVFAQFKSVSSKAANHNGKLSNKEVQTLFARQYLKEQVDLLEIMLLYHKEFEMPAERMLELAKIFQSQSFGLKQLNKVFLDVSYNQFIERIGYMQSLLLMSAVDLEMLRKINAKERSSQQHHLLLTAEKAQEVDDLYASWGEMAPHGPPLLGWVVFRFIALEGEQEEATRHLGQVALKCNVFQYLLALLKDGLLSAPLPIGMLCKKTVFSLLDLVLSLFHEGTLGDFEVLLELAKEVLNDPMTAIEFWVSDVQSGLHLLLKSTRARFPYLLRPMLDLLTCISKDERTAREVYHYVLHLRAFTELFSKNKVDEISATEDVTLWKRNVDHLLISHDDQKLIIPAGTFGRLFQTNDETRLIRWSYSYSGWLYIALELRQFLLRPYDGGEGESDVERATSIINLLSEIIQHDWSKAVNLDLLIGGAISIIDRFAVLRAPPVVLLASSLKCLRIVVQKKPDKVWTHLQQIGFLPRYDQNGVTNTTSSQGVVIGHLGDILMGVECLRGSYPVTVEYLRFFLEFIQVIHGNKEQYADFFQSIESDYLANMVLIARDLLGGFSQWRFTDAGEKETLAKELLQIANIILAQSSLEDHTSKLSEFKAENIILQGFLFHEAGEMLLNIISMGVDAVIRSSGNAARGSSSDLTQVVKLAFSLLIKVLGRSAKVQGLSPFEEALCVQCVPHQGSFNKLQDKATLVSVLANYIFYRHDAKLPTLAVMVLQRLCVISPISMAAALDPDGAGIRNAFITRLQQGIEPTRLKVAILDFIAEAAEYQPGLMELFVQLGPSKKAGESNKSLTFGKFSCLGPILEIVDPRPENTQPLVLLAAALRTMESFWRNRRDSVLDVLRQRENFWKDLLHHLAFVHQEEISVEEDLCIAYVMSITALEMYYAKPEDFDPQLKDEMKTICSIDLYSKLLQRFQSSEVGNNARWLSSWKIFLGGLKMYLFTGAHACVEICCFTVPVQDRILSDLIKVLRGWIFFKDHHVNKMAIELELAEIVMVLAKRWARSITDMNAFLSGLVEVLEESQSSAKQSPRLQMSILCTILHVLYGASEQQSKGIRIENEVLTSLLPGICRTINCSITLRDEEGQRRSENMRLTMTSICAINQVVRLVQTKVVLTEMIREYSILQALFYIIEECLQTVRDLKLALCAMMLLRTFSEIRELANTMVTNGVNNLLSLQMNTSYTLAESPSYSSDSAELYEIWCAGISITCNLLKSLSHGFLQSALDFIGAHKERLSQATQVMKRVHSSHLLTETEEVSRLLYELTRYPKDWHFSLPALLQSFQRELLDLVETTVALLSRPRLLTHLMEIEKEDHMESVLERARTPSPLAFDHSRSFAKDDSGEKVSSHTEEVQDRLLSVLANCIGCMFHLTPDVREAVIDECFDFDEFSPLVDLAFNSPSLSAENPPSFGMLLSCLTVCLKMLYKVTGEDSTKSPSSAVEVTDAKDKSSLVTFTMETTMVVIMSQATCYLRHPEVDSRSKQFLKRELGSEMSNFLHALHRYKTKRGIPPSPVSGEKLAASSLSVYKRSPSKLGPLFADSEDTTVNKLADIYTKQLLR